MKYPFQMKKLCSIIVFTFLILSSAFSQEQKSKLFRKEAPDRYQYIDSANIYENANPSKSFDYIEKNLTQSIRDKDKRGEALSYQSLGKINFNLNQIDLAIDYYHKAANLFRLINDQENLFKTYSFLGEAYMRGKDYDNSLDYYQRYLNYAEQNGDNDEIIKTKKSIAEIYTRKEETSKALNLLNDVLKTEKARDNKSGIIETQNEIGSVYQQSKKEDEALKAYEESAGMAASANDQEGLKKSLKNKSSVLRQSKRYDEELEVRKQLLDLNREADKIPEQAEENLEIGNIFIQKNEAEKAIPYLQKSIVQSDKTGNLEKKGKALQTLSMAYGQQMNYNKALEAYKSYVENMDALYKKREADILASMQIVTTLNRKLERLDLIEQDLRLSQKTVELLKQEQLVNRKTLQAQSVLTYSLSGALLILTIASVFVYRSGIQKRNANQLLALKSLRSQMNPHFIYNSLNSVNSFISKNDEKAANKYLSEFSRLMRSVMENSKHDFITLSNEIEILDLYLKLEHERFKDKFDYNFTVDPAIQTENFLIPPMLIQPFIENAVWHGLRYREKKGNLNIHIVNNNNSVKITIEDDGIGRKKSQELKTRFQKEHTSTGLLNIQNRIGIINQLFKTGIGILVEDADAKSGEGTRAIITIPERHG